MKKLLLSAALLLILGNTFASQYVEISELRNKKYHTWSKIIDIGKNKKLSHEDIELSTKVIPRKKLDEYELKIVNKRQKIALLRLRLKSDFDQTGGDFWDGFGHTLNIKKTFIPKMNRYNFPAISYFHRGVLTTIGFAPKVISSRFERHCKVIDGKVTICFDAYIALNPGESETINFFSSVIKNAISYTEGVEAVYNTYPEWFRPVKGGDVRLYGVGGYMRSSDNKENRQYYQLEDNRRLGFDWEWYYNPYQKAGDFYPSPKFWNPKQGFHSEKSHGACDIPGTVKDWENHHKRRTAAGDKTTALFYYYMQQYLNCDLLKNVYKDSAWVTEDGKPGYRAFGWGEEGWSEYAWPGASSTYGAEVRKDLALLWKNLSIAGFSLDCAAGDTKYYGPLVKKESHRAFDDNGKLFVLEGVATAYNIDYTHNLPAKANGRRPASVLNEPYTYLPIFHGDAVLHEMAPFEREDKIAPRRLQLGQKPYFWWGGFKVDNFLAWDKMTPDQVNEALTGVIDHTIMMSFRYGAVPPTFMSRGFPDMLKLRELFVLLQRAGWRAAPYAWVDNVPGEKLPWAKDAKVWVSRFGNADTSYIILSIPNAARMRGKLRIRTGKFNANGSVFADISNKATINYVTKDETVIDFDIKDHKPLILRKVGKIPNGKVTVKITKKPSGKLEISMQRKGTKPIIEVKAARVNFVPENLQWVSRLPLSNGQKSFAALVGNSNEIKKIGTLARSLEIYMEYFYGRKKNPVPYIYLMHDKFNKKLRFPVLPIASSKITASKTLFILGKAARKKYFPGVKVKDTIVYRKKNKQYLVGFFPGKLNEGQLISELLKKLDEYYPYYGGNNLVKWTRRLNFYGKTYIKGQPNLKSAVGSPTGLMKSKKTKPAKKISVYQSGDKTFIRSRFSKDKDIIIITTKGKNNGQLDFYITRLIPSKLPVTPQTFNAGISIHYAGDDSAPIFFNRTYLGGGHGAMAGIYVSSKNHGFSTKDLGSVLLTDKQKFYIAKIIDKNRFLVIPEDKGKDGIWSFKIFSAIKNTLKDKRSGRILKITKATPTQLMPGCRITKLEYRLDGRKLEDDEIVETGDVLEVTESYDIIGPDIVLDAIKKNPGKQVNFIDKQFAPVAVAKNTYTFLPGGACVIKQYYKINRNVFLSRIGLKFIQSQALYPGKSFTHEYYIPKTIPFEKYKRKFDFAEIEDFGNKLPGPIYFSVKDKNIADQKNMPDRFIQFLGKKNKGKISRQIGFALGYSLTEGVTIPGKRAKMTNIAAFIYTSKKTYPIAANSLMGRILPAGTEFKGTSYRQYFEPEAASKNATSVYWHPAEKAYVLYADYHKAVENDAINIPAEWNGRKITVVEKTPAIKITTGNTINNAKIKVSTTSKYNYIVIKIK
jgi:hypothetical protein